MITADSVGHHFDQDGYLVNTEGSLIYFVQEMGGDENIKIGRTKSMRARFPQLQTGSAQRLRVMHTEPGGAAEEARFHRIFAPYRIRKDGEWFRAGKRILRYVASAPHGRRGRVPFSLSAIPWKKALRPLGVTPRGAVRLLLGLLMLLPWKYRRLVAPKKHRSRSARRSAWISTPTLGGSIVTWAHYGPMALWGIIPAVLIVCYLAGRK